MERQNVTLSISKEMLLKARHLAVERGQSLSAMLSDTLARLVHAESQRKAAARRLKARLAKGFPMGTCGRSTWTREELHGR